MDDHSRVRPAWPADAPVLAALERRCFSDPWSAGSFRDALSTDLSFGLVAESGGEIAGYLIGRVIVGTGEILNLAVAPSQRRRGVARALLSSLLSERHATFFLEVRESNAAALAFYASAGFRLITKRSQYYCDPVEAAIVMQVRS